MLLAGLVIAAVSGAARADQPLFVIGEPVVPAGHRHRVAPICPPAVPGYPVYPDCPPVVTDPTMPPVVTPPDLQGLTTPFATQTGAGGLQGRSFNEGFDGDFAGTFYRKNVVVGSQPVTRQIGTTTRTVLVRNPNPNGPPFIPITVTVPVFGVVNVPITQQALVPVPGRYSGISITDNDSPRPTDRLYFHYSYYDGIGAQVSPGIGNITMNRPVMGFEKTFLGGDASIGLRLPFIQLNGPVGVAGDSVGDLSILTKYAFVNNPNGNVLSAGLVLTVPTGPNDEFLVDGSRVPHSTLFQPWVGFVGVFDRAYVQGISAIIIPTDRRDTTLWANSLGVGYWCYRSDSDRIIRGVIPVLEVHVRTPLNNRDINGLVFFQDQVNVTGGLHVRFPRATLGGAVSVPTIAPRPWNIEAIANFTLWF
jgi:hypothetical protein